MLLILCFHLFLAITPYSFHKWRHKVYVTIGHVCSLLHSLGYVYPMYSWSKPSYCERIFVAHLYQHQIYVIKAYGLLCCKLWRPHLLFFFINCLVVRKARAPFSKYLMFFSLNLLDFFLCTVIASQKVTQISSLVSCFLASQGRLVCSVIYLGWF